MISLKKIVNLMLLFIAFSVLFGCGPVYQTDYKYIPPSTQDGKTCVAKCQQSKQKCILKVADAKRKCEQEERKIALKEYEAYLSEMNAKGLQPEPYKNPNYFYRHYACKPIMNCDAAYRDCYRLCGGQIQEYTYCIRNCPAPEL